MNYDKYKTLPREKRLEKYAKIFSREQQKLGKFGLTFDNSSIICDFILSLPDDVVPTTVRYKGVYKYANSNRYYSKIVKDGEYIFIGSFPTAYEAAVAYDNKCYELYEDVNKLNFRR